MTPSRSSSRDEDIREDVFRASGAGGQHVNKTSSAIRLTHLPTGIVVQCQNERSQHKNRATAMKMLRARLARLEEEKREAEQAAKYQEKGQDRVWLADPQLLPASRSAREGHADRLLRGQLSERARREHRRVFGRVFAVVRGVAARFASAPVANDVAQRESGTRVAHDEQRTGGRRLVGAVRRARRSSGARDLGWRAARRGSACSRRSKARRWKTGRPARRFSGWKSNTAMAIGRSRCSAAWPASAIGQGASRSTRRPRVRGLRSPAACERRTAR